MFDCIYRKNPATGFEQNWNIITNASLLGLWHKTPLGFIELKMHIILTNIGYLVHYKIVLILKIYIITYKNKSFNSKRILVFNFVYFKSESEET